MECSINHVSMVDLNVSNLRLCKNCHLWEDLSIQKKCISSQLHLDETDCIGELFSNMAYLYTPIYQFWTGTCGDSAFLAVATTYYLVLIH